MTAVAGPHHAPGASRGHPPHCSTPPGVRSWRRNGASFLCDGRRAPTLKPARRLFTASRVMLRADSIFHKQPTEKGA